MEAVLRSKHTSRCKQQVLVQKSLSPVRSFKNDKGEKDPLIIVS
jgi:hypothetical protein